MVVQIRCCLGKVCTVTLCDRDLRLHKLAVRLGTVFPQCLRPAVCTDDFYSGDTVCLGGGLWRTELGCCCHPSRAYCVYSSSVCWSIGQLPCTGFSSALFLLCGFGCGVHDCAQEHDKFSYSLPHVGLIQFLDFLGQLFTLLNCKSEFLWLCLHKSRWELMWSFPY